MKQGGIGENIRMYTRGIHLLQQHFALQVFGACSLDKVFKTEFQMLGIRTCSFKPFISKSLRILFHVAITRSGASGSCRLGQGDQYGVVTLHIQMRNEPQSLARTMGVSPSLSNFPLAIAHDRSVRCQMHH